MNTLFIIIAQNAIMAPFLLVYLFIILAVIFALINIALAPKDDFDLVMFARRVLGSLLTILILIAISPIPGILNFIWAPVSFICLLMIREITVSLKFTGIDLTPLTIFVNIAIEAIKTRFGKIPG